MRTHWAARIFILGMWCLPLAVSAQTPAHREAPQPETESLVTTVDAKAMGSPESQKPIAKTDLATPQDETQQSPTTIEVTVPVGIPVTNLPPYLVTPTPSVKGVLEKSGEQILQDRPWLQSLYSWNETYDLEKQAYAMNTAGAYCIGNGKTFALVGLATPLWSWSNLYGDSYQEPDLGSLKMSVTRAGVDAWTPVQQIAWVKRSGVVRVHAEGKGIVVESYDFAPVTSVEDHWDNPAALIRLVHIINTGETREGDLDIAFKLQSAWNVKIQPRQVGNDLVFGPKGRSR